MTMKAQILLITIIVTCLLLTGCIVSHGQERPRPSNVTVPAPNVSVSPGIPVPAPAPSAAGVAYRNGLLLLEEGKYTDAIEEFNTSIDLDDSNSDAYLARGKAWYALAGTLYYELRGEEEFRLATDDFDRALTDSIDDADTYTLRGWSNLRIAWLGRQKHYLYGSYVFPDAETAIVDFTKALALHPDDASALEGRALAYSLTGTGTREDGYGYNETKVTIANADARKAMNLAPDDPWAHYAFAVVRRDADREVPVLYIRDFDEAIALDPDEPLFYLERAEAKQEIAMNQPEEEPDPDDLLYPGGNGGVSGGTLEVTDDSIIEDYETAIALEPRFATAYAEEGDFIGRGQTSGDDPDILSKGLSMAKSAIDINPDVAEFHVILAAGLLNSYAPFSWRGYERILAGIDRSLDLDPGNMDAHFYRWYVLNKMYRYSDAQEEARAYRVMAKTNEEHELATEMENLATVPGNVDEFLHLYNDMVKKRPDPAPSD
jgi:tetratricopeptide (TPR) repeat protein